MIKAKHSEYWWYALGLFEVYVSSYVELSSMKADQFLLEDDSQKQ